MLWLILSLLSGLAVSSQDACNKKYFSHLCSETDTGFLYHKTYRLHSNILQVLLFKHLLRIAFKSR